jgi:hypothetical protein
MDPSLVAIIVVALPAFRDIAIAWMTERRRPRGDDDDPGEPPTGTC